MRCYGSCGRGEMFDVAINGFPGGLIGVGAHCYGSPCSWTGALNETRIRHVRAGQSGDPVSRTAIIGCDAVGATSGCNNVLVDDVRDNGNLYAAISENGCTGVHAGGGAHTRFVNIKIENGGINQLQYGGHEVILNNIDCDGHISGTPLGFLQTNGTVLSGLAAGGVGDFVFTGTIANTPTSWMAAYIGANAVGDISGVWFDVAVNNSSGLGGGLFFGGCNALCGANFRQNNTTDTPLVISAYPAGSTIATHRAIQINPNNSAILPNYVDTGLDIAGPGSEVFNPATGLTYVDASALAGGQIPCPQTAAYSGAVSKPAGSCTTSYAATVPVNRGGTGQTSALAALGSSGLGVDAEQAIGDVSTPISSSTRQALTNTTFSAARTWTLPGSCTINSGEVLFVDDFAGAINGGNTLTLQAGASGGLCLGNDTLNGVSVGTFLLSSPYEGVALVAGSMGWSVLKQYISCPSHRALTALPTTGGYTCTQFAASDLSNGTTGSGVVMLATSPTISSSPHVVGFTTAFAGSKALCVNGSQITLSSTNTCP